MVALTWLKGMSRSAVRAATQRTRAISQHMMSTAAAIPTESTVVFESNGGLRQYILNRPGKLNALDEQMLKLLRPKIEEWSESDICHAIVASGIGRAFCSGGDVASVAEKVKDPATRSQAINYFKQEFEMDFILASLNKPYIAVLDGITMGGGVGLAANAPFRVATEKTVFAMPETKIGYCPDVGASYFLSKLDGELGTYFALTSDTLSGRAVFEHGFATHYIPSRRVPILLERLAAFNNPSEEQVDEMIEELSAEREPSDLSPPFIGAKRSALDWAFRHEQIEDIFEDLRALKDHRDPTVNEWAARTLAMLDLRSPTSLKIALAAIRRGKDMKLLDALNMELGIATAFCNGASPDFTTGIDAVLVKRSKDRPQWSPATVEEVSDSIVSRFFDPASPYLESAPTLSLSEELIFSRHSDPMNFCLPSEEEIRSVVTGSHPSGETGGLQLEELIQRFKLLHPNKLGVEDKVMEVALRRCEVQDNADGNAVWLNWIHNPGAP
ncbi:3-hydroxyisobutyryl-CoA hydrolase [Cyathus striatus]|nr:3-hydroxyisobutyryl-CoA hydrolase [Cyathus striatus]